MTDRTTVNATCYALSLALGLLLQVLPATANANGAEDPQTLYERGISYYQQERYDEALAQFVAAYNASDQPDILFNIAICHERLGDFERAIAYFEIYLEEKPDAADAPMIRQRITQLQAALSDGTTPPPFPPPQPPEKQEEPEETAPTRIVRTDVQTFQMTEPEKTNPLLWPSVGVAASGFVLIAGMITGIAAVQKYNNLEASCAPNCTDDDVRPARALAIATDVQLALGLVGAGLSSYFLIKAHSSLSKAHSSLSKAQGENPDSGTPKASLSFLGTGISCQLTF